MPPLEAGGENAEHTHAVLSTFARTVSPVLDDLAAMAATEPDGSVAVALKHLRRAFDHRGTGTVSPAAGGRWSAPGSHSTGRSSP